MGMIRKGASVPPGTIAHFAGLTPPPGWLACDGAQVSRVTYAALFAKIGTAYGAGDEGGGANLLADPENFETATWYRQSLNVTPNVSMSPVGTVSVDRITATASGAYMQQGEDGLTGAAVFSIFADPAESEWLHISIGYDNGGAGRWFNLRTLTLGDISGTKHTGAEIIADQSGLVRCVVYGNSPGAMWAQAQIRPAPRNAEWSALGEPCSAAIWGAKLEAGAVLTPYYGGTTFNLPDLRDDFIAGAGGALTVGQRRSANAGEMTVPGMTYVGPGGAGRNVDGQDAASLSWRYTDTEKTIGTGTLHPRNVALLPCIKY